MLEKALNIGLKYIGFTDHFHIFTDPSIFKALREIVEKSNFKNFRILIGSEIDVLNENGDIPISKRDVSILDYTISGQHHYHLSFIKHPPSNSVEDILEYAFKEIVNTIRNPLIDGLGHPWLKIPGYIREKLNIDFKFEDIPSEYFYKTCERI